MCWRQLTSQASSVKTIARCGPCLVGGVDQPLHQLEVALDHPGAAPQLHPLLGGEMQDEDVGAVVLLEMAERDVLPVAGEVGEGQHVACRSASGSPVGRRDAGCRAGRRRSPWRRRRCRSTVEELAEIVGDLGLPFAVLEHRPRSQTRLLRLDRGREHHVVGICSMATPVSCRAGPATSWMNCQATRPERAPRVTDHSTACLRSVSTGIGELVVVGVALDHGEEGVLVGSCGSRATGRSGRTATPSPRPPRTGLIAVERSFSIMSRGIRWRRLEVA